MAIQLGGTSAAAPKAAAGNVQRYPTLDFAKLFAARANGATDFLPTKAIPFGGKLLAPPGGDVVGKPPVDHNAVRAVVGKMPPPPLSPMQQAQKLVANELSPLESAITSGYTGMASRGAAAIKQATDAYANELAAEHGQLTAPYTQAETAAAASQDAFANRVTGAGTSASDELAQRLASIGEPGAVNPVVAGLAGKAIAAGNAVYGTGNATLDQLISQKAAAEGYASKLPGVARTAGLQQLGQFEGQVGANESKDLLALEEKAPGLISSTYGTLTSAAGKAQANKIAQERVDATKANTTANANKTAIGFLLKQATVDPKTGAVTMPATTRAELARRLNVPESAITGVDASTLARITQDQIANGFKDSQIKQGQQRIAQGQQTINQGQQKIVIAQKNADTSATRAATAATRAAAAASNADGRLKIAQQHEKAYEQHLKQGGTLSPNELNNLVGSYHSGKNVNVRVPTVNADGKQVTNSSGVPQWHTETQTTGQLTYDQAIKRLVSLGKTRADAVKAVNGVYDAGDGGRPYTLAQARQVAAQGAAAAYKAHVPYKKALASAVKHGLPRDVVESALQKAYYSTAYSPVPGSAHYGG